MNGHQPQRPVAPRPHPAQIKAAKDQAAIHEEKAAICKEILGGLALLREGVRKWHQEAVVDGSQIPASISDMVVGADQLLTALGRYTQSTERDHEAQAALLAAAVRAAESGIVTA